jgi:threonine/homoserine efflux transporter RhtA
VLAASKNTLKVLSAVVWLSGAIVLLLKGASLFVQAIALQPRESWSWLAVAAAVLIGAVKAKYLFSRFCRKNLDRIDALDDPQLWQAFRPAFYIFLTAMVVLGATLSRLAMGNYPALIALVILDISIAIALLGSMRMFRSSNNVRNSSEIHRP